MRRLLFCLTFYFLCHAASADEKEIARFLAALEPFPLKEKPDYGADIRKRRDEFNRKDLAKWRAVHSAKDWDKVAADVRKALRDYVVPPFVPQAKVKHLVTGTIPGDGFVIENVVYETVPGLVVTANLYRPEPAVKNPPAFLIIHSHHNPKTQGELQDMGMTWARLGCLVLIPDMLGHGERRQHPFKDAADYPAGFKVGRQDYYFRYNIGVQLALVGESQIGWMARDMMRGVDLVLERGADPKRIILLGSVAGGGDPSAVTAAADERITCVVPFNFGGPQPETRFPLPEDAEARFNYHGGGSWESTRSLPFSASGGFPPWAIVASVAPRKLIHAHEFAWDKDRDPVWKRYETIWTWYGDRDGVGFTHGRGAVTGKPPEATHCNNIGPQHRAMIYPYLKKWFDIPIPEKEYQNRVPSEQLQCLTEKAKDFFKPKTIPELAREIAGGWKEKQDFWERHFEGVPAKTREVLTGPNFLCLENLLDGKAWAGAKQDMSAERSQAGFDLQDRLIHDKDEMPVAAVRLFRPSATTKASPLVVAVAQQGAAGFVKERAQTIATLLNKGVAVALVDVRNTGVLASPGDGRGRTSGATSYSISEWMMGQSTMGQRLRDLRTALDFLRDTKGVDPKRILLWGDSFAPANDDKTRLDIPYDADKQPRLAEPLGPILVQFAALEDPAIKGVYGRGGLTTYASFLDSTFFWTPHDVLIPGVLTAGDLPLLAARLAPRPVRLEGLVSAMDRPATAKDLEAYAAARKAYGREKAAARIDVRPGAGEPGEVAAWMLRALE
ncbi:MAG: hypothetical protein U0793_08120 [Gemmataceae bacterium]